MRFIDFSTSSTNRVGSTVHWLGDTTECWLSEWIHRILVPVLLHFIVLHHLAGLVIGWSMQEEDRNNSGRNYGDSIIP